ncbi:c-type cytochrome biogenesis protein CcmI [Methylothermus subterraneus]
MTLFWLLAAGLMLLIYALFGWSLRRPLQVDEKAQLLANLDVHRRRRLEWERELKEGKISPTQFDALIVELERELLDLPSPNSADYNAGFKGLSAVVAALGVLPLIALALYFGLGRPDLLGAQPKALPDSLEAGVERLKARLQDHPNDLDGWLLLARSYQALNQPEQAKAAYEQALALAPDDLDLKARYAELLAQLQGGDFRGKPTALLQEILKAAPDHPYALWLSGLAALHRGDRAQALKAWQTLLAQLPPDSEAANQLRAWLAKAGLTIEPPVQTAAHIQVKVQLSPNLASQARPEDPVYIFARAAEGPPMPLAIVRKQVKDLPLTVTLDDTMAMLPQLKLSKFKRIVLGARVAKSGNAQGAPGDLEGWTEAISIGKDTLPTVVIDRVRS